MMNNELKETAIRERIHEKIDRGIEQLTRGEELDGEQALAELETELDEMEGSD